MKQILLIGILLTAINLTATEIDGSAIKPIMCGNQNKTESIYQPLVCIESSSQPTEHSVISVKNQDQVDHYLVLNVTFSAGNISTVYAVKFEPLIDENIYYIPNKLNIDDRKILSFNFNLDTLLLNSEKLNFKIKLTPQ